MITDNYSYAPEGFPADASYEDQLLLNYDQYLQGKRSAALKAHKRYTRKLVDLKEDLVSEYDENDWEEEQEHVE
ncbi:hypothetical protein [Flavobacterium sp. HTF]|uniref:hypothetical protein n=1 Tax=Flavobacterium sp. HTF TaxID=2170732 RepID=UPI000D5D8FE8|nr:hypothetical protein [Flavobacterium sp. HTF]PWB27206.1 hypothetical protein DCO46_04195 [Flavobacterium sp. HTF]